MIDAVVVVGSQQGHPGSCWCVGHNDVVQVVLVVVYRSGHNVVVQVNVLVVVFTP